MLLYLHILCTSKTPKEPPHTTCGDLTELIYPYENFSCERWTCLRGIHSLKVHLGGLLYHGSQVLSSVFSHFLQIYFKPCANNAGYHPSVWFGMSYLQEVRWRTVPSPRFRSDFSARKNASGLLIISMLRIGTCSISFLSHSLLSNAKKGSLS